MLVGPTARTPSIDITVDVIAIISRDPVILISEDQALYIVDVDLPCPDSAGECCVRRIGHQEVCFIVQREPGNRAIVPRQDSFAKHEAWRS